MRASNHQKRMGFFQNTSNPLLSWSIEKKDNGGHDKRVHHEEANYLIVEVNCYCRV